MVRRLRTCSSLVASLGVLVAASAFVGCAGARERDTFEDGTTQSPVEPSPPTGPNGDFGNQPPPPAPSVEISEVFGHSEKTLFRLDPQTKAVTVVGDFDGCANVIDIALDEASNLYATTNPTGGVDGGLYKVDKATAKCTLLKSGRYPNSLSFVPKGTVDPNVEALVGYNDDQFVRIDPTTGSVTNIGSLQSGDLISSGDIVAVKGSDDGATPPKAFLTVKNSGSKGQCADFDCLVEVDPKSGKVVKFWGKLEHDKVYGLAFWGGSVYGFDDSGKLFEVTFNGAQLVTAQIPVSNAPPGLRFWGAGSSTSVPLAPPAK